MFARLQGFSIVRQMKALPEITQDLVRGFMKKCHKPRAKKEEEVPTIWRMMPDNLRACQIGPIYNQSVGVMLQNMMDAQGRSAEAITAEAIIYYYTREHQKSAEVIDLKQTNSTSGETEIVEYPVPSVFTSLMSSQPHPPTGSPINEGAETAPSPTSCATFEGVETAPDLSTNFVTLDESASWDTEQVVVEEDLDEETFGYELDYDIDEDSQGSWSFEPEEEDDIEDYQMLTTVEATSTTKAPHEEQLETVVSEEMGNISTTFTPEMAPVNLLIQTFQTAASWQEISEVLKTYEEYKQDAWNALTHVERRRIIELTPPAVRKLSNAKREGLIMNFRVEREGVYHIQENGCFIWDVVFDYRLDDYLARL